MIQVFIVGSSSAYGVGASQAGWADLIKHYLHDKMYGAGGIGEAYEVFNFSKAGEPISFIRDNFENWIGTHGRNHKTIVIASFGGNNSKAEDAPDNYVSTIEEYTAEMGPALDLLLKKSDAVIFTGNGYVDESKTNPKPNPLTGGQSYFSNERRLLFRNATKQLCDSRGIDFAEVEISQDEWCRTYLYEDGLHPNQAGHQLIFESLKPRLEALIQDEKG